MPYPPRITVLGFSEYANPKRGPMFQLLLPAAWEALNTVAPRWPSGFWALGSKVEKRLNSSVRPPCQSNRSPNVKFRFFITLTSSLPQNEPYFILGIYLNGTEKLASCTWPRIKEANSFPVPSSAPFFSAPADVKPAVSLSLKSKLPPVLVAQPVCGKVM